MDTPRRLDEILGSPIDPNDTRTSSRAFERSSRPDDHRIVSLIARLRAEIAEREASGGAPIDLPEPEYRCAVCRDIGLVVQRPGFDCIPCPACREERMQTRADQLRLRSNIPARLQRFTLDSFRLHHMLDQDARTRVLQLKTEQPRSLYLHGPNRGGKTGLSVALLNRWMQDGIACRYWYETDLLDAINPAYDEWRRGPHAFETLTDVLDVPVLLLDDLGCRKPSEWSEQELTRIVNHRFDANLATLFTSNYPLHELAERVSVRCAARIKEQCVVIAVEPS